MKVYAGQTNVLTADVVARADGTPIVSGTVTGYLQAKTGTNAAKWYKASDGSWAATEQSAGALTHVSDGHWALSLGTAVWTGGVLYSFYFKESTDLHIPVSLDVLCESTEAAFTLELQDGLMTLGGGATPWTYTLTNSTGGTPLADALVRLTTDVGGTTCIASSRTNASGVATFYPDVATSTPLYVWATKTGYDTDAYPDTEAMGTSGSGTATSVSAVVPIAAADGFLARGIANWRLYTDEPGINSKYSDANIIEMLQSSYGFVLGEIIRAIPMGATVQVAPMTYCDITLGDGDEDQFYALPPHIKTILKVRLFDSEGNEKTTLFSHGMGHPGGKSFRIEDNVLWVAKNTLGDDDVVRIDYYASGAPSLHDGTASAVATDGTTVTLAATPSTGTLDTHPNAYAGCRLRILGATTNGYTQERNILSYNHVTRVATLSAALSPVPATSVVYEVCPVTDTLMDRTIVLHSVLDVLAIEVAPQRYNLIKDRLANSLRDLRLFYGQRDAQSGGRVEKGGYR
jgi:hypothetical protein